MSWKRWSCVEYGCDFETLEPDETQVVAAAQGHIADAHDSFELEEMILAVIEDAEPPARTGE
jgi:predicted small metal-binding protein